MFLIKLKLEIFQPKRIIMKKKLINKLILAYETNFLGYIYKKVSINREFQNFNI